MPPRGWSRAVRTEILAGEPALLVSHALLKAQAKDYVRRSQERLIAQPLLERLRGSLGGAEAVEQRLLALLEEMARAVARRSRAMGRATWSTCCACCGATCGAGPLAPRHPARLPARGGGAGRQPGGRPPLRGGAGRGIQLPHGGRAQRRWRLPGGRDVPARYACGGRRIARLLLAVQGHTGAIPGVALSRTGGCWPAAAWTGRSSCGRPAGEWAPGSRWPPCRGTHGGLGCGAERGRSASRQRQLGWDGQAVGDRTGKRVLGTVADHLAGAYRRGSGRGAERGWATGGQRQL